MDIQQLSTMVRDLILQQDKVVIPGLGVFTAELVPASFSDRGYTLNPPYRKLGFQTETAAGEEDPRYLLKAEPLQLQQCVEALHSELKSSKYVELPLLGKLRLTTSGELFFVADPDLDIYPDAFGLHPVSMKNHDPHFAEAELAAMDVETPMIEPAPAPEVKAPAPEVQASAPAPAPESQATGEPAPEAPGQENTPTQITMQEENTKKKHPALKVIGIVVLVLMIAMIAFRLLALVAPELMDSILYTEEELRMLGK